MIKSLFLHSDTHICLSVFGGSSNTYRDVKPASVFPSVQHHPASQQKQMHDYITPLQSSSSSGETLNEPVAGSEALGSHEDREKRRDPAVL